MSNPNDRPSAGGTPDTRGEPTGAPREGFSESDMSLDDFMMDSKLPYDRPADLFFRYRNRDFLSNTVVLTTSRTLGLVCHSSRECTCGIPAVTGKVNGSTFSPWPLRAEQPKKVLITDIDDDVVTVGGEGRLAEALEQSAAQGPRGALVVAQMCDYECLVEDIEGVAREVGSKHDANVLTFNTIVGDRHPLWHRDFHWGPFLASPAEGQPDARDERGATAGINLVGLGPVQGADELERLLTELGVEICGSFFPYFDIDDVAALHRARLWVVSPWRMVELGPGHLLEKAGLEIMTLPVPHGVDGTLRWIDRILTAIDLPPLDEARRAEILIRLAPERDEVMAQALGVRVAFVVPERYLAAFASPTFFYGMEPLSFLREMGFEVVLVTTRTPDDVEVSGDELLERVGCADDEGVRVVQHEAGRPVVETLRDLDCELIYSEYEADARVAAAGKVGFDVRLFEPGIQGALRTARRLVSAANVPFFRRYRGYLDGGVP